jgi:hypothetical protein
MLSKRLFYQNIVTQAALQKRENQGNGDAIDERALFRGAP